MAATRISPVLCSRDAADNAAVSQEDFKDSPLVLELKLWWV